MTFLTRQEKYVIVFLVIGAVCGLSYSYYKRFHPPIDIRFMRERNEAIAHTGELDALLKEEKSVNINSASMEELMKLKGIGPVLAYRIMQKRKADGPFKDKEELKEVPGIGTKKFEAIEEYVSVE